jgi:hypothetical protein
MDLPKYKHLTISSYAPEELENFLQKEINLNAPTAIDLKKLTIDQQKEIIGLIQNFLMRVNGSFLFPYPIYLISELDQAMSSMPLVKDLTNLPRFFSHKESKINVKESQVLNKNKLLQKEIFNSDFQQNQIKIEEFANRHKLINRLENERLFYRSLLNKLNKRNKNG